MKRGLLFLIFIGCVVMLQGQNDTTLSKAQKRSIRIRHMRWQEYGINGKICGLLDSSICFDIRPGISNNPGMINIAIADIKSIKVRGKRNYLSGFLLGALIGGIGINLAISNLNQGPPHPSGSSPTLKGIAYGGLIGAVIFPFKFGRTVFHINGKKEKYDLNKAALEPYVVH